MKMMLYRVGCVIHARTHQQYKNVNEEEHHKRISSTQKIGEYENILFLFDFKCQLIINLHILKLLNMKPEYKIIKILCQFCTIPHNLAKMCSVLLTLAIFLLFLKFLPVKIVFNSVLRFRNFHTSWRLFSQVTHTHVSV